MRAELKEAKRAGIDPAVFEAWEKTHADWLQKYLALNQHGSLAERKVRAYRLWRKLDTVAEELAGARPRKFVVEPL